MLVGVAPVAQAETPSSAGTVTAVSGPVTVARLLGTAQPLRFRDDLFWRDMVESRKGGIARVLLAGKTTVTVRELSRLELREEVLAEGVRYTAELVSGKLRASVARMLMRHGDQVEIRTKNAVASVRGTDFIVETLGLPSQAGTLGLFGVRQVAQLVADGGSQTGETVVVTLSGQVDVANRLAGTGRVERVRAYEAVRVSGRQDPLRFQFSPDELRILVQGLTPPRPQEARSGDKSEAVGSRVEGVALAASAQSVRVFKQAEGGGGSRHRHRKDDQDGPAGRPQSRDESSQAPATPPSGGGNGGGLALGQGNAEGSGQGNGQSAAVPATPTTPATPASATASPGNGQGNGLALGQGNSQSGAVPATAATPATPASATASPGTPAMPATPAVAATPPALATPAGAATPATPAAPSGTAHAGVGPGVGKPATPPGQAKK